MSGGWRRAVAALAVALLASGCATIPTSGPIQQGEQVGVDREDQFIRVIARPPLPGMTPTQVVQGFLAASASFDGDHAVARQYLTETANAAWEPAASTVVYDGTLELAESGGTQVRATATKGGTITEAGRYDVAPPGKSLDVKYALQQVEGEWRISSLPQGLLLSRADVDRAFRTFDVYFFDPTYSILVPDPRTIPVSGRGLATSLVQRLLAGPTTWLAPAVRTGFPDGTGLALDAVPIDNGVARVDLTAPVLVTDDATRRALSAQLVWTLRQLPDVSSVEITALGQPLAVPGVGSPQPQDAWASVDPGGLTSTASAYAVADGRALVLSPNGNQNVLGGAGEGKPPLSSIAVSPDESDIAGIDKEGALVMGPLAVGGTMVRRLEGDDLAPPSYGTAGAWVVDRGQGIRLVRTDGSVTRVPVDGLPKDATVLGIAVARDGTRAALTVRTGTRTGLLLARIVQRGTALRLSAPIRVESRLTDVLDVAWSDADELAVLGSDGAAAVQAFSVDTARGRVRALGAPEEAQTIAAAPGRPILVGAADGRLYQLSAGTWRPRTTASAPAYPG